MEDSFLTIQSPSEGLYKEKGSKFIAYAYPVISEDEIKQHLAHLKKEHYAARHWCYAYRLGADKKQFRANDDGEPSGTAGKPILNQIISANLTDVLIVVVRYFGGTLLGTSGLIQAYKGAAVDTLDKVTIITKYVTQTCKVNFNTNVTNFVMRVLKENDAQILQHNFTSQNEILFSVRSSLVQKLILQLKESNIPCSVF